VCPAQCQRKQRVLGGIARHRLPGRLQLTHCPDRREVEVSYDVLVEPFPAFEMYARLDSGPVVPLFLRHPDEAATPLDIVGPPNIRFRGSETLTCR